MQIKGWKYYNHAAVPINQPYDKVNLAPIKDGSIWNLTSDNGARPLLVSYISDFDTSYETSYWYIIKDGPFVFEELSKKYQKQILKVLERCEVKRIDPVSCFEDIYAVYKAAMSSYKTPDNELSKADFHANMKQGGLEYWGAYNRLTGVLVGWMSCRNNGDWTETVTAKYHPELQSFARPSDAIHYAILNYYLNELGQKYICSGSRNINHKTNVQDYKIKNWKFRKAYCKLHILYRPGIGFIIKSLYPFRKILRIFYNITLIHQVCSLLKMEEISRGCK